MVQIIGVSDARNNLAKLIKEIKTTKDPIVIVQDSAPSVVIYPYEDMQRLEEEKRKLVKQSFEKIFIEGNKKFKQYLKKKNIPYPTTDEEVYNIIKNA